MARHTRVELAFSDRQSEPFTATGNGTFDLEQGARFERATPETQSSRLPATVIPAFIGADCENQTRLSRLEACDLILKKPAYWCPEQDLNLQPEGRRTQRRAFSISPSGHIGARRRTRTSSFTGLSRLRLPFRHTRNLVPHPRVELGKPEF